MQPIINVTVLVGESKMGLPYDSATFPVANTQHKVTNQFFILIKRTCSMFGYGLLLVGVAPVIVFLLCKTRLGLSGYILKPPSNGLSGVSLSLLELNSGNS